MQDYVERRFDTMEIETALAFAEFFKDLGLWNWNIQLMLQIKEHFRRSYINYEIPSLCKLVKLIAYNHMKDESFLSLIEESINLRVTHALKTADSLKLNSQDLVNLTEGMSVKSMARKRLNTLLKTMIILEARKGQNFLTGDTRLTL